MPDYFIRLCGAEIEVIEKFIEKFIESWEVAKPLCSDRGKHPWKLLEKEGNFHIASTSPLTHGMQYSSMLM